MWHVQHYLRLILPVSVVFLLLAMIVVVQSRYDELKNVNVDIRAPIHRFAMPAPVVKHLAFGFNNTLADYYWLIAVQDFNKWDGYDAYYPEYFRIISALDPKFAYPYIFAALTVPNRVNREESLAWLSVIAERGMQIFPESWEIPFYVGMQYHIVGKSDAQATHYFSIANAKKDAPPVVRSTYAIYLMKDQSEYKRSRALFDTIVATTDNQETKKIAKERIALLDFIEALDQAVKVYKSTYGKFPNTLEEIAQKGMIKLPPELVNKFPIHIDQSTGKVTLVDARNLLN